MNAFARVAGSNSLDAAAKLFDPCSMMALALATSGSKGQISLTNFAE
jgi:hypothetical protein